jgi:hypothetical protein
MPILPNVAWSLLIESWRVFRNGSMSFANFPSSDQDRSELRPSLRGLLIDGYIAFPG